MAEPATGPGLSVRGLRVCFGETVAVDGIDLELPAGEVLAVLGPSGCGKSTLLRAIAGLETPDEGQIEYAGQDLASVPTHRRGFALMFQDGQLFNHRSVAGNVGYSLRLRHLGRRHIADRVAELLDLVGLAGYADRMPASLSGGERQRVALARALAVEPRLLLLDEPLSALDRGLRERLAGELREILHDAHTTALLVTHDQEEAFAVADRMAVMRAGVLVQEGTVEEVWRHPVDAWTAGFLGYPTVLTGPAALGLRELLAPDASWTAVALRRSAIRVDPDGPLEAKVLSARQTPEQTRLELAVVGIGPMPGVAESGLGVRVGETVRIAVAADRIAPVASQVNAAP